jgi:hypothetical protein
MIEQLEFCGDGARRRISPFLEKFRPRANLVRKMSDDGKDEKKKDGEEEEELDCSHPEVVNKYQQAGAVANGAILQ